MSFIVGRSKEVLADTQINADGDTFSSEFKLSEEDKGQYIELNVSNYTTGSFTATLQHSPDGSNWYDLSSTSALTANGQAIKLETTNTILFRTRIKISASSVVTTGATVNAKIHY